MFKPKMLNMEEEYVLTGKNYVQVAQFEGFAGSFGYLHYFYLSAV